MWYPVLLSLIVDFLCLLPVEESTILQIHTVPLPIKGQEVQQAAWPISGNHARKDSLLRKILTSSLHHGDLNSEQSYNSLFHKWECWCNERNRDPNQGSVTDVVNFLVKLYEAGYSYSFLNCYHSAILSVHEKVDDYLIGQHPLTADRLSLGTHPPGGLTR